MTSAAGVAAAPAPAGASTLCETAAPYTPGLVCVEAARGLAAAADRERAATLLALAEGGADRFAERFGRAVTRHAIVEGPKAPIAKSETEALRKAGFVTVLPWLSREAKLSQIEAAIRRSVTDKLVGQPDAVIEAAVKSGVDQATRKLDPEANAKIESSAVPHELGHDWYRVAFWPNSVRGEENSHYSGPGPDWLDEMSAVLMEAPAMFDERVVQFGDRYRKYKADPSSADESTKLMIDLPHFFNEKHPAIEQVRALRDQVNKQGGPAPTTQVLVGPQADAISAGAVRFYLQSAVGALYLAERTGDPKVFARIGAAFSRGETMEQWLANDEPKGKLPKDLKRLQKDWLAWLEKKYPAR